MEQGSILGGKLQYLVREVTIYILSGLCVGGPTNTLNRFLFKVPGLCQSP
jgi:hypothetical protein